MSKAYKVTVEFLVPADDETDAAVELMDTLNLPLVTGWDISPADGTDDDKW